MGTFVSLVNLLVVERKRVWEGQVFPRPRRQLPSGRPSLHPAPPTSADFSLDEVRGPVLKNDSGGRRG